MALEADRCECGHPKRMHIYEEGACRPGFPACPSDCKKYRPVPEPAVDFNHAPMPDAIAGIYQDDYGDPPDIGLGSLENIAELNKLANEYQEWKPRVDRQIQDLLVICLALFVGLFAVLFATALFVN